MQRLILSIVFVLTIAVIASPALAQADAQKAYEQANAALQAGNLAEARDLAKEASETDPNNAEVFLLLGRAHYGLGELDEAVAAWKRTLALAPEEPFAKRMLDALQGRTSDIDLRITIVEAMVRERLYSAALKESGRLLSEKVTSDGQRAKVMILQAESLVRLQQGPEAQKVLRELTALYPQQADAVQTALLSGEAKLQGDPRSVAEALAILEKLVADHPETPAAVCARYDIIRHAPDLRWKASEWDEARAEAMAKWLAANADHEWAAEGRSLLMGAYLAIAGRDPKPAPESELSANEISALALAAEIYRQGPPASEADKLTGELVSHLKNRYLAHGAYAAAVQAMEVILVAPLSKGNRLTVLRELASAKYNIAAKWLDDTARAGKLPVGVARGKLPEKLSDVLTVFETVRKEYPAEPLWIDQANLAKRVRASSARVLPTAQFKGLKGPDAWALDVAMPVVAAGGTDAAAVKSAVETVQGIITERAALNKPGSRKLAVDLSTELLTAISTDDPNWAGVITSYYTIVQNYTPYVFQENIKDGRSEENAKLSDLQKAYLATLKKHVLLEARHAPFAVVQLAEHLAPWIEHGHWAVAEEAYAAVVDALPEQQRRQVDLAVVNLWIGQTMREHQRLIAAGLTVQRQLDPALEKALQRCYELQAGLDDEPAILSQVRGVWDRVLNHYRTLEYYDVVNAAIAIKAEQAVAAAAEYAQFTQARELDLAARRELTKLLKQYGAAEKIVLSPAFQKAIAAYTKFITDRPTSPLVARATESVLGVGRLFEQHKAYLVAASVYADFATFAAGVNVLSQSAPGTSSTAEQVAFAVAIATDAEARKLLAEQAARRKSDDPPPAKLSKEFAAAIAAYKAFIGAHGESPLVAQGTSKIMAIALEYAKIDAWDVADSVYADLLGSKLDIRRPERLMFARGLCQLGRAMPDHAGQVLSALTTTGLRGRGTSSFSGIQLVTLPHRDSGPADEGRRGASAPAGGPPPAREPAAAQPVATPPADPAALPQVQMSLEGAADATEEADRDSQLLAVIRQQQSSRAAQVAQLRDNFAYSNLATAAMNQQPSQGQQQAEQQATQQDVRQGPAVLVLSEAELTRQATAIDAAYKIFQGIRTDHAETPTAEQARGEILVMVGHWRTLGQWQRSAALAGQFLADNATELQRPKISLEIARDRLSYASKPIERKTNKQEMMAEVAKRFDAARAELASVVAKFPKERSYQQQAQWDVANSYLTQARVVGAFSPTLARGQYVRTAKELTQVARQYPDHPNLSSIPQMLWSISTELAGRGFNDEAILVWNELTIYDPMHALSQQAATQIANTYHQKLKRPLLAAEAYQELYYTGGAANQSLLDAIFQIGSDLKTQKRYVEALHVLETFVDSFPRHPQAGQALTMAGQIHQTNEAWKDAIAAYRRVLDEFENGQFVQESKWAIAECTINLSQWREAADAYRDYVKAYPKDAKIEQANQRIEDLKGLARYQGLVDEDNQRKAFDAQFQIATIVRTKLANPVKAIIEFRKVASKWPTSHLADDALYEVGATYASLGETEKAREALLTVAKKYPTSPLADDALFMVGKSFEDEAGKLATATRATTLERNKEVAQRRAYQVGRDNLKKQQEFREQQIADLKQAGKGKVAEAAEARFAGNYGQFNDANTMLIAQKASQEVETATATQLADRQDKINAALRKAVEAYTSASKVGGADKADESLLQMATIYDQQLKDPEAAMQTWLEIVAQFSGTTVAEDASWRIAETYESQGEYAKAIDAYNEFLRNYRGRERAGAAQFAVAENYENLGKWINAMDAYTNYITNYPEGPLVAKAKQQITWIKTYRL